MSILRHLRVFAVALPLYGCIVVVSPFDVGEHCGIAGDSACATCLRTTCQASIDACCKSTTCSALTGALMPMLAAVDSCGRGDKDACASATSSARTAAEDEAVRACIATECKTECTDGGTPTKPVDTPWTCETPPAATPTNCATCIYEGCAPAIDECCADSTCGKYSGLSKELTACTSGDALGCVYAHKNGSTSGLDGVVRACIQKKCAAKCFGDGVAHQNCQLYSGGTYCSCSDAEERAGPECSAKKVGGRCVLAMKGCVCGEYSCDGDSRTCSCNFHGGGGSTGCVARSEGIACCLKFEDTSVTCSCDYGSCNPGREVPVPSCEQETVFEELTNYFVDVCSR